MKTDLKEIFGEVKPKGDFSSGKITVLMGDTGSGKTTLAATASEVGTTLLINFENRVSHIDESDTLRILPRGSGDFRQDVRMNYQIFLKLSDDIAPDLEINPAAQPKFKVKHIILDTFDEMFTAFHQGMLKTGEISDRYYGRPEVYHKMWELGKRLKDTGTHVIIPAQSIRDDSFGVIDLAVPAKLKSKYRQSIDNIFYYKSTDNDSRILRLKPDSQTACKLTVSKDRYNDVPSELVDPTWKDIVEAIGA